MRTQSAKKTTTSQGTTGTVTPATRRPGSRQRDPISQEMIKRKWERYRQSGSQELRQELLNRYVPLVKSVAGRMAMGFPKTVELSDLISTGVLGLVEAMENFDPERGVKFETFAVPRIRGAILDELRSLDWVPRSTRTKARQIDRAKLALENKLGRVPSHTEVADKLAVTVADLLTAIDDVSCTNLLSLDELVYREEDNRQVPRVETVESQDATSVLNEIERQELRAYLVDSISNLTDQEKLVIALYYYEELTLKEIGEVMRISESRVSQIHTKAIGKLRDMVAERFAVS